MQQTFIMNWHNTSVQVHLSGSVFVSSNRHNGTPRSIGGHQIGRSTRRSDHNDTGSHGIHSGFDGCQSSGVSDIRGSWGQHAQFFKELLVVDCSFSFPGNLVAQEGGVLMRDWKGD